MRRIILTGFMGTGKSTIGKILALRLGCKFVDTDSCIVASEGCTINTIFAEKGEAYFRQIEKNILIRVLKKNNLVVSTGGGAVISSENRHLMRYSGIIINLYASPDIILRRLENENERPLLQGEKGIEIIEKMILEREPFYAEADIRIDTTHKNVEDVVSEILLFLEMRA
jgi:shikimate kinase